MSSKKGGKKKEKKGKSGKKEKGHSDKEVLTKRKLKLEEELRAKTELCLSLETEMKEARSLYEKEVGEKDDLSKHLKNVLEREAQKASKFQSQMDEAKKAFEPGWRELKEKVDAATQKFEAMKDTFAKEKLTISGKMSMLKDAEMQRKGFMQKLNAAEQKVEEETEAHEEKLREAEIGYTMLRQQLKEKYLAQVQNTCTALNKQARETLTYIIKRGLENSLEATEQMNKLTDEGLELHMKNVRLESEEMLLNFEIELGEASDRYLTAKTEEFKRTIEKLQNVCEKQERDANSLETEFQKFREMSEQLQQLNCVFLEASDEFQELQSKRADQNCYLNKINSALLRRQAINSKLVSVIKEAEEVFRSQLAKPSQESQLEPTVRRELLQQFVTLTDISHAFNESKSKSLLKQRGRGGSSKFSVLNRKKKDASVQTTDILTKYGKKKEFKCHFFEGNI